VTDQPDSPLAPFLSLVGDPDSTVQVVTLVGITDADTNQTSWRATRLDIDVDLRPDFKAVLRRTLRAYQKLVVDTYEPGWVPIEGELAVAHLDVLEDSDLYTRIVQATERPAGAQPAVAGAEAAENPDLGPIHAYAIVVARVRGGRPETAVFVRNRTPVEELRQGRVTAVWHGQRLSRARHLLSFDAGIDVAILGDTVLIKTAQGFERLFVPPEVRIAGARHAVELLANRIAVANVADLFDIAERDSIFGSKLRLLGKTGLLNEITTDRLRQALRDTGLVDRFIVADQLIFPAEQGYRWRFLDALEDSFVISTGTGILYRSASKKRWQRRLVTGVMRGAGIVTQLCGPGWGPTPVDAVAGEIRRAQAVYYIDLLAGPHNLTDADLEPAADGNPALAELTGLPDCH
jgi:hypothetical protein